MFSVEGTIGDGVLFYVKDGTTRLIQPKSNELKGILHLRNEAAAYLGVLSERSIPGWFFYVGLFRLKAFVFCYLLRGVVGLA